MDSPITATDESPADATQAPAGNRTDNLAAINAARAALAARELGALISPLWHVLTDAHDGLEIIIATLVRELERSGALQPGNVAATLRDIIENAGPENANTASVIAARNVVNLIEAPQFEPEIRPARRRKVKTENANGKAH